MTLLKTRLIHLLLLCSASCHVYAEPTNGVQEIMISTIAPMSDIIWQAQGISTTEQWQQVEKAALAIIEAGNGVMARGGENDQFLVTQSDWQHYNQQMIDAAKKVIVAVQNKDEDALFETGNMDLYPPCESCHQQYKKW